MIESFYIFKSLILENFIKGIFISTIVLILSKYFFKHTYPSLATNILRWIILTFVLLNIFEFLIIVLFSNESIISLFHKERAFGDYWISYWFMMINVTLTPLILFHKKLGKNLFLILLISLLINFAWLFESFIIRITNFHQDFRSTTENIYLPYPRELIIFLKGSLFGIGLIILSYLLNKKNDSP